MTVDVMEKIGAGSLIQHGSHNRRIYLMKLADLDMPGLLPQLDKIAAKRGYGKIFAKTPARWHDAFLAAGYQREASISRYYRGAEDCHLMSRFTKPERSIPEDGEQIFEVIRVCRENLGGKNSTLSGDTAVESLREADADEMADIYRQVFETYPFPIHDPEYLRQTMRDNIRYLGIRIDGALAALSSAEIDRDAAASEMTDFATLPSHRGKGYARLLLAQMEKAVAEEGVLTVFTIARAVSFGMNLVFARAGYDFAGTLINNTGISGRLESMNVWHRANPFAACQTAP
jgi:putative beta-lysine N-acetyltransferase